jgi:hypothetical protein
MVIPANVAGFRSKLFKKTSKENSKETLKKPTPTRKHLQERVMRHMISGLVAAVAVMAAAPAMACGFNPCGQPEVYVAPAPAYGYSGCNPCGGWAHERLADPEQQYYYVNQGPTYTGPGDWAPRPTYHESSVSYGNPYYSGHVGGYGYGAYRHHHVGYGRAGYYHGARMGYGYGAGRYGYGAGGYGHRAVRRYY